SIQTNAAFASRSLNDVRSEIIRHLGFAPPLSCAAFFLSAFGIVRASARIVVQSKAHPWLAAHGSFADGPLPLKATPSLAAPSQAGQRVAALAARLCAVLVQVQQAAFQLACAEPARCLQCRDGVPGLG